VSRVGSASVACVTSVKVRVPAKINLSLRVGPLQSDGYHELATIFHAVSLTDELTVATGESGTGCSVKITGEGAGSVPTDESNLAVRAAKALAAWARLPAPDLMMTIDKSIPVAGGMAGGSADAAAALVACKKLWGVDIDEVAMRHIAAGLGADVAFSLLGGTALGSGRGDVLTPVLTTGELHWVIALADGELSTPKVYAEWDRLVAGRVEATVSQDAALLAALRTGDPRDIGPLLGNDLQMAAIALRPSLRAVLEAGDQLGALGGVVSGSGPTCVFLATHRDGAIQLAAELSGTGLARSVRLAHGPVPGARLLD
jgi:4-diphosphocytidyl-2-C-methyl-D-erythritol kinase